MGATLNLGGGRGGEPNVDKKWTLFFADTGTSMLGVVGQARGRIVLRLTAEVDMARQKAVEDAKGFAREFPGCHLHGALPCTGWTSW